MFKAVEPQLQSKNLCKNILTTYLAILQNISLKRRHNNLYAPTLEIDPLSDRNFKLLNKIVIPTIYTSTYTQSFSKLNVNKL